jgi:hypothetical protein
METISISIPTEVLKEVKKKAKADKRSLSNYISIQLSKK